MGGCLLYVQHGKPGKTLYCRTVLSTTFIYECAMHPTPIPHPWVCAGYAWFQSVKVSHQMIPSPLGVVNVVGNIRQLLHNAIGTRPGVVQLLRLPFWDNRQLLPSQSILLIVLSMDLAVTEILLSTEPQFEVLPHLLKGRAKGQRAAAYSQGDWVRDLDQALGEIILAWTLQ